MSDDDDKVRRLPIRFKEPTPEDRTAVERWEVRPGLQCSHSPLMGASYIVDDKLAEVECSKCGEKLNPMWVLAQIAREDRRMQEARQRYREEMARLSERSRTKCEHCQRMTRISRAKPARLML